MLNKIIIGKDTMYKFCLCTESRCSDVGESDSDVVMYSFSQSDVLAGFLPLFDWDFSARTIRPLWWPAIYTLNFSPMPFIDIIFKFRLLWFLANLFVLICCNNNKRCVVSCSFTVVLGLFFYGVQLMLPSGTYNNYVNQYQRRQFWRFSLLDILQSWSNSIIRMCVYVCLHVCLYACMCMYGNLIW